MNTITLFIDLAIGIGLPLLLTCLRVSGRISGATWRWFWMGAAIGLLWEVPLHFAGPYYHTNPLWVNLTPWPLPPLLQPVIHALWDGGIFLVGVGLVRLVCRSPHFIHFRAREVLVLVLWGVGSALVVELSANGTSWLYHARPWNPVLFTLGGVPYTALPIIIWMIAPLLFYQALLRTSRPTGARP